MRSSIWPLTEVTEFPTPQAYSNSDLTEVKYNSRRQSTERKREGKNSQSKLKNND
jgi:hypothetical protein